MLDNFDCSLLSYTQHILLPYIIAPIFVTKIKRPSVPNNKRDSDSSILFHSSFVRLIRRHSGLELLNSKNT